MKTEKKIKEELVGSGQIAGIGIENPNIPNQAEPGKKIKKKIIPFKMFTRR